MTVKPDQCFRMWHTPELKAQYVADWGRLTAGRKFTVKTQTQIRKNLGHVYVCGW